MSSTIANPFVVPVARQIDLPGTGGLVFPADLTGDGRHELLVLQTPGLFHARIHGGQKNAGWNHFCLTALTQAGDILWQVGSPWQGEQPYKSHGGERSLVVCDLDGDGQVEVYVIRGSDLLGLDPLTGKVRTCWRLPYDNFLALCAATVGPDRGDRRLLASVSNAGYGDHAHGGPACMFDALGRVVFERDVFGAGHDPIAFDMNDDGFDEWLIGYEKLDRQGKTEWRFQPVEPTAYDDMEMHVDGVSLYWPGDRSLRRIAYAASAFVFVLDASGRLLWEQELVHPQQVIFAHLLPNDPRPQLFVLNKRDTLQLFDFDGRLLWTHDPQEHWPHGKPAGVAKKFHLFDPCLRLCQVTEQGLDAIVYLEGGWPYALDGYGQRVLEFECPASSQQAGFDPQYERPDDYGAGYVGRVVREQGGQRLIVGDRNRLWLFDLPGVPDGERC